jgi:hypothetical protein
MQGSDFLLAQGLRWKFTFEHPSFDGPVKDNGAVFAVEVQHQVNLESQA